VLSHPLGYRGAQCKAVFTLRTASDDIIRHRATPAWQCAPTLRLYTIHYLCGLVSYLSENIPDDTAETRTPAMNIVEANGTRKFQPQTKLNWTQNNTTYGRRHFTCLHHWRL